MLLKTLNTTGETKEKKKERENEFNLLNFTVEAYVSIDHLDLCDFLKES